MNKKSLKQEIAKSVRQLKKIEANLKDGNLNAGEQEFQSGLLKKEIDILETLIHGSGTGFD